MYKKRSIEFNYIMNIILTFSSFAFPLISFPYISRVLSPNGVGKINFATSFIAYFNMLSQLGIPVYGIRTCAKVRDNYIELSRTVHELLIINLIMNICTYLILALCVLCFPRLQRDSFLLFILSTTIIMNSIGMEWLYKGLEQYSYITIRSVMFKFIAIGLMFVIIKDSTDYILYGAISVFASSASNIMNFIRSKKIVTYKYLRNYQYLKHVRAIATFFVMNCATTIYTNLDVVMIGFIRSDLEVGLYSTAVKIRTVLLSVTTALGSVLYPRSSYYYEKGDFKRFREITYKAVCVVVEISFPLIVYFEIYSERIIVLLAGEEYKMAQLPLCIILPTIFFVGISNITGFQILLPSNRERIVLVSEIVGSIVDLLINSILIFDFGIIGVAIGTLMAEIFVLAVQLIYLKQEIWTILCKIDYFKIISATILSSILSLLVEYIVDNHILVLLLSSIIFGLSYVVVLYLLKEKYLRSIIYDFGKRLRE